SSGLGEAITTCQSSSTLSGAPDGVCPIATEHVTTNVIRIVTELLVVRFTLNLLSEDHFFSQLNRHNYCMSRSESRPPCDHDWGGPAIAVLSLVTQGWMITYLGLPWKLTLMIRAA